MHRSAAAIRRSSVAAIAQTVTDRQQAQLISRGSGGVGPKYERWESEALSTGRPRAQFALLMQPLGDIGAERDQPTRTPHQHALPRHLHGQPIAGMQIGIEGAATRPAAPPRTVAAAATSPALPDARM
jgi:hypothetical protein